MCKMISMETFIQRSETKTTFSLHCITDAHSFIHHSVTHLTSTGNTCYGPGPFDMLSPFPFDMSETFFSLE